MFICIHIPYNLHRHAHITHLQSYTCACTHSHACHFSGMHEALINAWNALKIYFESMLRVKGSSDHGICGCNVTTVWLHPFLTKNISPWPDCPEWFLCTRHVTPSVYTCIAACIHTQVQMHAHTHTTDMYTRARQHTHLEIMISDIKCQVLSKSVYTRTSNTVIILLHYVSVCIINYN